jgi:hypothetical protein
MFAPPLPTSPQPPPPPPWEHFIDPDTPSEHHSTVALGDRLRYRLVMSDEFEREGRRFDENENDIRWTAVSRHDYTNDNLAYMTPDAVTTRLGALEVTTTNTGFRDSYFASGSVQGWNKFCMQGGIIDISYTLPGRPGVPGVWPGIWMMGNLGRATFTLSTEGLWPWSYSSCQRSIDRTKDQLISACNKGESMTLSGLQNRQGRGVPEIDILEARPCSDLAAMGGKLAARNRTATCGLNTLQMAPRLPMYLRPRATHFPDATASWYRDLRFGAGELNPSWCDRTRRQCPRLPPRTLPRDAQPLTPLFLAGTERTLSTLWALTRLCPMPCTLDCTVCASSTSLDRTASSDGTSMVISALRCSIPRWADTRSVQCGPRPACMRKATVTVRTRSSSSVNGSFRRSQCT